MSDEIDASSLEVLAILSRIPDGVRFMNFVELGLNCEAVSLLDGGFIERIEIKKTRDSPIDDSEIIYKINEKGSEYFKKILEYSNQNYPK